MSDSGKKDSFIIYQEYADYIADLTGDEVKTLFTAIFLYREGKEIPEMSGMVKAYFKVIRNNLDRDERKYEATIQARIEAGRKGGKQKKANLANASSDKQSKANVAVSVPVPVPENDNGPVSENDNDSSHDTERSQFAHSPKEFATAWETVRGKWNEYPVLPVFPRLFLNLFTDEREKFLTMLSAHGVDGLCMAIENYAPVASDPAKYGTEAKFLYKSLPNFLKAADKYMIAPTPNIQGGVEDFTKYNALMQREG